MKWHDLKYFEPELAHYDEWHNPFYYCPVPKCAKIVKEDGLIKHIVSQSRAGEPHHRSWLEFNQKLSTDK